MAINISNVKEWWNIKFYKEEWFFKDIDEFTPFFVFFLDNEVSFTVKSLSTGFSIFLADTNLKSLTFDDAKTVLTKCLDFKKQFGEKSRLPNSVKSEDDDDDHNMF